MTPEKRMEDISMAYLSAVAAHASVDFERFHHDEDSVDCMLKKEIILPFDIRYKSLISVQLKSTASANCYSVDDQTVYYDLKIKNYNDLRKRATTKHILCLLILPKESEKQWLIWTEEQLLLNASMYWVCLEGEPETKNTTSVRITIPRKNVLNSETLSDLMKTLAEEEVSL